MQPLNFSIPHQSLGKAVADEGLLSEVKLVYQYEFTDRCRYAELPEIAWRRYLANNVNSLSFPTIRNQKEVLSAV